MFRLRNVDIQLLEDIAEYRLMTISQLTELLGRNRQSLWRRLGDLEKQSLLQTQQRQWGRQRGRPEVMVKLSLQGWDALKRHRPSLTINEKMIAKEITCQDHQLLLNWFRIQLLGIQKRIPPLTATFLAHSSPLLSLSLTESVQIENEAIRFVPDAVFSLTDREREKSLLFFLEVDCNTETLASPRRTTNDIRQKIINYQACARQKLYHRYEQLWQKSFCGFRLLFLTVTPGRLASLCQLVGDMGSSDFIWLADQHAMFDQGLGAAIWSRGGNSAALHSILGSLAGQLPAFAGPVRRDLGGRVDAPAGRCG